MRCLACGRLPTEECCEKCHRAARLSTYGELAPTGKIPPSQAVRGRYVIGRSDHVIDKGATR